MDVEAEFEAMQEGLFAEATRAGRPPDPLRKDASDI